MSVFGGLPCPKQFAVFAARHGSALLWACARVAFLILATRAQAQTTPESSVLPTGTGTLEGKLTDWHSVPLAQATVVVRNLTSGAITHTTTGKNGSYRLAGLGPGEYSLEAEVPQLGKGQVEGILISAGRATRVQAALVMELPRETTPAETDLHELDPAAAAVTTLLSAEELGSLPVSSRNWQAFLATTPAANPVPQSNRTQDDLAGGDLSSEAAGQSVSLHGAGEEETASSIDGLATSPAFHSGSDKPGRASRNLGESAVLTMEARTGNNAADAAQSPGGAVNFLTGHGGDGLHGQAFYLNRQNLWGARNPFTQWVQQTALPTDTSIAQFTPEPYTPGDMAQTFGLGVGSQFKRDKLFWFAALDGLRRNDPAIATVRHPDEFFNQPTNDELAMLAARLDLTGASLFGQENAAYSDVLSQMAGLLGPVPRSIAQWQSFARIDWQLGERHHLSIEGNAASEDAPGNVIRRTSATYGSHSFGNSQASEAWGLARWDSFLTVNLLNDLTALYGRYLESETAQAPSPFESSLIFNDWNQLPEMIADSKYGFILGKPARLGGSKYPDEHSLLAQDTLSWVRGQHLVKAGGNFNHISDATNTLINQTGTYSYTDVFNFISDVSTFAKFGTYNVGVPTLDEHNCDATGRIYHQGGAAGPLAGRGDLPCYAWYSQRIGPSNWTLSTNDFAAFVTEQWQPFARLTLSAGVRVEAEQLPPTIPSVSNPELPVTQKLPAMRWNWGPRFGLAWSPFDNTVLRLGAGLYYGRIDNSAVLAALTQTGSPYGDLNFFFRPNDPGAPAFPAVFPTDPATTVTPGAVAFASGFRPQEVDQAVFSLEQRLPSHWLVAVSAMASLGRRLPISIDTNLASPSSSTKNLQTITYAVEDTLQAGPIKTPQITVPFYTARLNSDYQQLATIEDRANSTYDAAMIRLIRYGGHGLSLHAHYLYTHATDWNPNESDRVAANNVLDPSDFKLEYGTSNLDVRHIGGATLLYETPWKLRGWAGQLADFWSVAAVGQYRSGLPYTIRTAGYVPSLYAENGDLIQGVATGMNGSGGDNRIYGIARNTYRYPGTYTADARLSKRFNLANHRELQLLAESFNLFNHQNVTLIETTGYTILRGTSAGELPVLRFLTGLTAGTVEFGKPLDVNANSFYRQREIQLGLRARF